MNSPPSGLVTFLFSDIEDQISIAQKFPDQIKPVLESHDEILNNAVLSNSGFVFKTIGNSFCCAFTNAKDAVKSAKEIQQKLNDIKTNGIELKVKIGIHTGHAEWNGSDYMGYITLARTQRVMSSAHGQQAVISETSYNSIDSSSLKDVSFRDLGQRKLKDLIQPLKIYQIMIPEVRIDFPPLKTLDERPNNLPFQTNSFIGREKELNGIKDLLRQNRIVTLTGTGGTGKSRLSLQIAAEVIDEFKDGVWLIELASLRDQQFIQSEIMKVLGLQHNPLTPDEKIITSHLRNKELLLILDNCEHLIHESASIAESILRQCPYVKLLTTSREPLKCEGEFTYLVPSLTLPEQNIKIVPEVLVQFESVRLFIERALAVNSAFRITNDNASAVASICNRLDGIPLALELAAARTKILSPEKINEKLNDRFRLLADGKRETLQRQKTLKALIDWSYDLLNDDEKSLWSKSSVFSGGWNLEDAEGLLANEENNFDMLEVTASLVEKSIIVYSVDTDRYRMLESIREYGLEKLKESGAFDRYRSAHMRYFSGIFINLHKSIGNAADPTEFFNKIETEYQNIQSALTTSYETKVIYPGIELACSLSKYYTLRGKISDARYWFDRLMIDMPDVDDLMIAKAKRVAAIFESQSANHKKALQLSQESLHYFKTADDKNGISLALSMMGLVYLDLNDFQSAEPCLTESLQLKRELKDEVGICSTLNSLGLMNLNQGMYTEAGKYFQDCLDLAISIDDKEYMSIGYNNLAQIYGENGDIDMAVTYFEKGLELDKVLGNLSGMSVGLSDLAVAEIARNNFGKATELFEQSIKMARETGYTESLFFSLAGLGIVKFKENNFEEAKRILRQSLEEQSQNYEYRSSALAVLGLARIIQIEGNEKLPLVVLTAVKNNFENTGLHFYKGLEEFEKIILENSKVKVDYYAEEGKKISFEKAVSLVLDREFLAVSS